MSAFNHQCLTYCFNLCSLALELLAWHVHPLSIIHIQHPASTSTQSPASDIQLHPLLFALSILPFCHLDLRFLSSMFYYSCSHLIAPTTRSMSLQGFLEFSYLHTVSFSSDLCLRLPMYNILLHECATWISKKWRSDIWVRHSNL